MKKALIILLIIVVAAVGVTYYASTTAKPPASSSATIQSVVVLRPDIVVKGAGLSRVEIWAIPTGTGLSEHDYVLLGQAAADPASPDTWLFPIPANPVLAAQIFAKGLDKNGASVTAYLPVTGATDIYDALWATTTATSTASGNTDAGSLSLRVGETKKLGDLALTLNSITEDSRCPKDVQCVWAGDVGVSVSASYNNDVETLVLKTTSQPAAFGPYTISIGSVIPEKTATIQTKDYVVTFNASKNAASSSDSPNGVSGLVMIGPTCPVQRTPPDPNCADKPYAAKLRVKDSAGKIVKTFTTDPNGAFAIALDPGAYTIENASSVVIPTLSPVSVTVKAGEWTDVTLSFDSGIR